MHSRQAVLHSEADPIAHRRARESTGFCGWILTDRIGRQSGVLAARDQYRTHPRRNDGW